MRCTAPFLAGLFSGALACAQVSVCDLFKDLKAADGRQLFLTGDLVISKDTAVLGAADCDNHYSEDHILWPTGLRLHPSARIPAGQLRQFRAAAEKADGLRRAGRIVSATGSFAGRIVLETDGSFPAKLVFDSLDNLRVDALPDASELPVIPICDLFQNLAQWKGKRIAVRAESVSTMEGHWLTAACKGGFVTNGYRWPVSLDFAGPAYYSGEIASLVAARQPSDPPKGNDQLRSRYNVVRTATYVGRLRMHAQYTAVCRADGDWLTLGFGHLGGAAAELIVDTITDVELTHRAPDESDEDTDGPCEPPNLAALCSNASTLESAASIGCLDRAVEILSSQGIDSKDGSGSAALDSAITTGRKDMVELLLQHGAPVNPLKFQPWPSLWNAANRGRTSILKMLLKAGADVDGRDDTGATLLASFGFFDARVTRVLLEAGANPNAVDRDAQTPLMYASGYGYEDVVRLLVQHGANVDLKDKVSRTALMHAAVGKYVDAIPILLEHGADVYARDADGKTALDIAKESNNQVAVEFLTAAMK